MKKGLAILLCIVMLVTMLAGCNNTPGSQSENNEDRPTLKLFVINGNYSEGATKDSVWKAIEDAANVNIEVSGMVNSDDYYTTLSPRLNSATDMPDVFFSGTNLSGGTYFAWADQAKGILYDWTNLMAGKEEEYPYLNKIFTSDQYKNVMFEGAHTLLPFCGAANSGWGIYYRGDWLIKIGYYTEDENGEKKPRVPVNMDEFQDVMMKFSDPSYDLNPGTKTYGMSPFGGEWANQPLYHAFGAPTDYDLDENGNVEFMCLTEEYKNFLTWFHDCYEKGWIDPQFYTNAPGGGGGDTKAFEEGRIGILITNAGLGVIWNAKPMEDMWGKGTCIMGPPPVGTATVGKEGACGWSNWGGMWGGFSITKACKDPEAALRLFNFLYSPEGEMLCTYGIQGVHWDYDETGTKVVPNLENRHKEPEGAFAQAEGENGNNDLYGKYRFASLLVGDPILWDVYDETGNFAFFNDMSSAGVYADLAAQSAEYFDILATSKLVNFNVLPQALNKKTVAISDLCNTYAVQAIAGQKNLTTDYDALVKECEAEGLQQIYDTYHEAAVTYGLIE